MCDESKVECDCPFCPLIRANTQVCGVSVVFPANKSKCFTGEDVVRGSDIPCDLKRHLAIIVLMAKNNMNLKVGRWASDSCADYEFDVHRVRDRVFTICFHTKQNPNRED